MNKIVLIVAILISFAFAQQNQEQQITQLESAHPPQEPQQQTTQQEHIPNSQEPPQQQVQPPQGYAPAPQGYAPAPQGYVPAPQGYVPAPQGYVPAPQGYVPVPQGYVPAPQGYVPAPQGYVPAPQGYVPEQQQQAQQPQEPQPKAELKDSVLKDSVIVNKDTGKGFYIRLIGGYAFGTGKTSGSNGLGLPSKSVVSSRQIEYFDSFGNVKSDEDINKTTTKNESFSLGEGLQFGAGIGYMFNKNIGIDLHGSYFFGSYKISNGSKYSSDRNVATHPTGGSATTTITKSSSSSWDTHSLERTSIMIAPALRLVAPISDAFSFYSLMGISIPISDELVYEYEESRYQSNYYKVGSDVRVNTNSNNEEQKTQKFTPYFELNYSASLGLNYAFGKVINLFVEANINTASFEVKKGEITKWKQSSYSYSPQNGNSNSDKDLLDGMSVRDKETDYQKDYTVDNNSNSTSPSKDSPRREISFSLPASSIGINSGLMFKF